MVFAADHGIAKLGLVNPYPQKVTILVDGFISSAALLVASCTNLSVLDYAIFTHQSNANGHKAMLDFLGKTALIDVGIVEPSMHPFTSSKVPAIFL